MLAHPVIQQYINREQGLLAISSEEKGKELLERKMLETSRLIGQLRDLQDALPKDIGDSLDFSRIVVIVDQSLGKSSLIESIVGRELIP